MRRASAGALLSGAAAAAFLCYLWPAAAALFEILTSAQWHTAAIGPRRIILLARTIAVALAAAGICVALGAAVAAGLVSQRRRWLRLITTTVCLAVFLTPPYIYAYAWSLPLLPGGLWVADTPASIWPDWVPGWGRAVWCLGTWLTPLTAAILALGWKTSGRPALRLALVDAHPRQALLRAVLPAMSPWLALALAASGVLALTEYSVCQLCQVQTWNTEVLAEIQSSSAPPGNALLLTWPLLALVVLVIAAWFPFRRTTNAFLDEIAAFAETDYPADRPTASHDRLAVVSAVLATTVLLIPGALLALWVRDWTAFGTTWSSYLDQSPDALGCALGAALIALVAALGVDYVRAAPTTRRMGPAWKLARAATSLLIPASVLAAVAPPALVGDAFLAAYARSDLIANSWLVVSLLTAARFAAIPILALRLTGRSASAEWTRRAAVDGAGWFDAYFRTRLPLCAPILLISGAVVGLLSLSEVAGTQLVRPAGLGSLAVTLLNEIHYGRNDQVIAASLYLMAFVFLVVLGMQALLARLRA